MLVTGTVDEDDDDESADELKVEITEPDCEFDEVVDVNNGREDVLELSIVVGPRISVDEAL